jgi:hypothetical protein
LRAYSDNSPIALQALMVSSLIGRDTAKDWKDKVPYMIEDFPSEPFHATTLSATNNGFQIRETVAPETE